MARHSKCPAPEVHLLGDIVTAFGNLEIFLEGTIWQLLGQEDQSKFLMAQALTAEMSFDRKVHALASMFRVKYPKQHEAELESLVASLSKAQEERNALMHSAWNYSADSGQFERMKATAKAKRGLVRRVHTTSAATLETVRGNIDKVANDLVNFTIAHIQPPDTPREKDGAGEQGVAADEA